MKNEKVFIGTASNSFPSRSLSLRYQSADRCKLTTVNCICMIPTLTWTPEGVRFIDQTKLPLEESYVLATSYEQVAEVIVTMVVRGAPAIGVSAAYGIALGAPSTTAETAAELRPGIRQHLRPPCRHPPHRRQSLLGH